MRYNYSKFNNTKHILIKKFRLSIVYKTIDFNMKKTLLYMLLISFTLLFFVGLPEQLQSFNGNSGYSKKIGTRSNGKLENAYLFSYSGNNFKYFSWLSYYAMDNGYIHSKVHNALIDAYQICEKTCPNTQFKVMECANKKGGKMRLHRTHQNGMSVDFMVPKIKNNRQYKLYDQLGLFHYLLNFTKDGKLKNNEKVSIDFETTAKHILALDDAAKKNGLVIKRVILKSI